jgi:bacillithiol system protein YtxJ
MNSVTRIYTEKEWENIKTESSGANELLLFKYSPRCGISLYVEKDFDRWYSKLPAELNLKLVKVNVVAERPLSQHIAKELQIIHQSPQLIWIGADSSIRYSGSHNSIEPETLNIVLETIRRTSQPTQFEN